MSKPSEDAEMPFYQKAITMIVFCIVLSIVFLLISSLFKTNDSIPSGYKSCETRFDSTACSEPDNDEWLKNNPDLP